MGKSRSTIKIATTTGQSRFIEQYEYWKVISGVLPVLEYYLPLWLLDTQRIFLKNSATYSFAPTGLPARVRAC